MLTFTGRQPVQTVLSWLAQQIADADAAFQISQQRDWNAMAAHPILEGHDRLVNLGLKELAVSVALAVIKPPWYRRLWNWMRQRTEEPRYRLQAVGDGKPALSFRAVIARDEQGRWGTVSGHTQISRLLQDGNENKTVE